MSKRNQKHNRVQRKNHGQRQVSSKSATESELTHTTTKPQTAPGNDLGTKSNATTSPMHEIERLQAWFNGLLVIAAFVGVCVSYFQLSAMRTQSDLMANQLQQMRQEQRPWLAFETPEVSTPVKDQTVTGTIVIKNVGSMPATLTGHASMALVQVGPGKVSYSSDKIHTEFPSPALDFEETLHTLKDSVSRLDKSRLGNRQFGPEYVVVPGESVTFEIKGARPINEQDLGVIENEDGIIAIAAYVRYEGAAEGEHESWSCFVYDPITKKCRVNSRHNRMN